MPEPTRPHKRFGRYQYDGATATLLVGGALAAAVVLGVLAYNYQGSPRMDDRAKAESGATIPHPTALSPAQTTTGTRPAQ